MADSSAASSNASSSGHRAWRIAERRGRSRSIAGRTIISDGEALAAAAGALGVGIVEHEAGGEIVLAPVHDRADQIEDGGAVDVEDAAGRLDLLVELRLLGHIVDRIGKARAAAPRR